VHATIMQQLTDVAKDRKAVADEKGAMLDRKKK
jgi:hypothetical protein